MPAPNQNNPNQIFPVGDGFGLFVFFGSFGETHFQNGAMKRQKVSSALLSRNDRIIGLFNS